MQSIESNQANGARDLRRFARKTSKQEAQVVFDTRQAQRIHKLGAAVAALTKELSQARRELSALRAENGVLRKRLNS
jgi:hypothetical protein